MLEHTQTHLRRPFLHSSGEELTFIATAIYIRIFLLFRIQIYIYLQVCVYLYHFDHLALYVAFVFPLGNLRITSEDGLIC